MPAGTARLDRKEAPSTASNRIATTGARTSNNAGRPPGRLRRALGFAFPFRHAVLAIFLVTIFLAAINAAEPLILKYVFDGLTTPGGSAILLESIGVLIVLSVFREITTGYSNWQTWHARLGIHYALLESTVERLHRMPLSLHRSEGVGAIMTK